MTGNRASISDGENKDEEEEETANTADIIHREQQTCVKRKRKEEVVNVSQKSSTVFASAYTMAQISYSSELIHELVSWIAVPPDANDGHNLDVHRIATTEAAQAAIAAVPPPSAPATVSDSEASQHLMNLYWDDLVAFRVESPPK